MTTTGHDDLDRAQRRLDDLVQAVRALRRSTGDSIDLRRVGTDVDRVCESLALLRAHTSAPPGRQPPQVVSDAPYDPGLFRDADDEGVGGMRRPLR